MYFTDTSGLNDHHQTKAARQIYAKLRVRKNFRLLRQLAASGRTIVLIGVMCGFIYAAKLLIRLSEVAYFNKFAMDQYNIAPIIDCGIANVALF